MIIFLGLVASVAAIEFANWRETDLCTRVQKEYREAFPHLPDVKCDNADRERALGVRKLLADNREISAGIAQTLVTELDKTLQLMLLATNTQADRLHEYGKQTRDAIEKLRDEVAHNPIGILSLIVNSVVASVIVVAFLVVAQATAERSRKARQQKVTPITVQLPDTLPVSCVCGATECVLRVATPCGHLCACDQCFTALAACPKCEAPVTDSIRIVQVK